MTPELLSQIEEETGFATFERPNMGKPQYTFYGTSDQFAAFKTLAADKLPNGSLAYLMDTGESHMYSAFKKTWY